MKLNEMQYNGLNIWDEISIVEIAFDECRNIIHVFDTAMTVEPEYNFTNKQFELSDGFIKMAAVIKDKKYFTKNNETLEQWIDRITWQFYCSSNKILTFKAKSFEKFNTKEFTVLTDEELYENNFYPKYVKRMF